MDGDVSIGGGSEAIALNGGTGHGVTYDNGGAMALPSVGNVFRVTGTTNIRSLTGNVWDGREVTLIFLGALTLMHSGSLALNGAINAVLSTGSVMRFVQHSAGVWSEVSRSVK